MAKHLPSVITQSSWDKYPKFLIKTVNTKELQISFFSEKDKDGFGFNINRRLARLLVKRLNDFLDYTK